VGQSLPTSRHPIFRALWWSSNVLLTLAFAVLIYSSVREYSVRRYLDGFSDAIVPDVLPGEQNVNAIPNYPREYNFENFAHVRVERLPLYGLHLRGVLDSIYPGWDEAINWSLFLERESFFYLVASATAFLFFLLMRTLLGWYADRRLRIPRFHLREHAVRAGAALISAPEIKE